MTSPEFEEANLMHAVEGEVPVEGAKIEATEQVSEEVEATMNAQMEAIAEAIETDPASKEAAQADVAAALKTELSQVERGNIKEEIVGIEAAMAVAKEGGEVNMKDIINGILERRYNMTLTEFLSAFKPTKLEYLNPHFAIAAESAIWVASEAFDVEVQDFSLMQKAEFRWKVGADVLKVFALLAKFIPAANVLAVPSSLAGEALGRMGGAMEKINANPEATIYDTTKDLTVAVLPRDEQGNIDRERVLGIISVAGGMVAHQAGDSEYVRAAGEALRTNPERFAAAIEKIDSVVNKE